MVLLVWKLLLVSAATGFQTDTEAHANGLTLLQTTVEMNQDRAAEKSDRSATSATANVTRPAALHATKAHHGFEANTNVNLEPRSSWSRTNHHALGLLYQLHARVTEDDGGGAVFLLTLTTVVAGLIAVGCCGLLYIDADEARIKRETAAMGNREAPRRAAPLTQQSLLRHTRESGGIVPSQRNSLALGATPLATPLNSRMPSAAALLPRPSVAGPIRQPVPSISPLPAMPQLFAPVVTKPTGEVFAIHGAVLNGMQDSHNVRITRADTGAPYALIYINENPDGCAVLAEILPKQAFAFFDTMVSGVHVSRSQHSRYVPILRADADGWDPTSEPVVVVAPSVEFPDEIAVTQPSGGGRVLLQVKLEADGQVNIFTTDPHGSSVRVHALLEAAPRYSEQRRLFVNCGIDPLLVLCSMVAAIKIGVQ